VKPLLISFEGLDGSGKTTQLQHLLQSLATAQVPYASYREPGGTPLGECIRRWLKEGFHQSGLAELLLFNAARAELVEAQIRPDLEAGRVVVLDRFADSSWAYQGALGLSDAAVAAACTLGAGGLEPGLTIWLDIEPEAAIARRRTAAGRAAAVEDACDAIEGRDLVYFERVRQRYAELARANAARIIRVDGAQPEEAIKEQVKQHVFARLAQAAAPRREVA
jgi:dTMP kinase